MPQAPTQQLLELDQIKEGVVVLKNKALRGVVMVSSQNFALKSDEEQQAIIYQFQNFLNSLDFSLEIVVQSRILNITGYLDKLKDLERKQKNELLKVQTAEYHKFIKELIAGGQILAKNFFVVVPFTLIEIPGMKKAGTETQFQRAKSQLWQRMEFVALGPISPRRVRSRLLSGDTIRTSKIKYAKFTIFKKERGESFRKNF